jgi:hypothetical protein
MFFDNDFYEINGISIEWGKTLSEVKVLLENVERMDRPPGGWPGIRFKCERVFGLPAKVVDISAPFEDEPVLLLSYYLAPANSDINNVVREFYEVPLKKIGAHHSQLKIYIITTVLNKRRSILDLIVSAGLIGYLANTR